MLKHFLVLIFMFVLRLFSKKTKSWQLTWSRTTYFLVMHSRALCNERSSV